MITIFNPNISVPFLERASERGRTGEAARLGSRYCDIPVI